MDPLKDARLRDYLARISPSGSIEELAETAGGLEMAPEPTAATETIKKLARGEALDRNEQFALEAIIIPDKRPAIDIVGGDFEVRHQLWLHWNEARVKEPLRRTIRSVGRIELPGHPRLPYGGTGFVVGDGLLMTNRHVAEIFANGIGLRDLSFIPGRKAAIDFLRERDRPESINLAVRSVVMIHPYWDMALLRVEGLGPEQTPLQLALIPPEELVGKEVAVIGYPAFDPRNPADVQDEVFGGVYEVKRLQPGLLGGRSKVDSYGSTVSAISHDSSTLGGNSGAAAVDPESGSVFALHFSGAYLVANYGVPAFELGRDGRVIDAGVRFAGSPVRGPTPWDASWRGHDKGETPAANVAVVGGKDVSAVAPASVEEQESASFTIPLEITVRLGRATLVGATVSTVAAAAEKMVEPFHETDYSTRPGYDPDFLGLNVPLPTATDETVLARTAADETELRYHHFSVLMHKKRRLALMTASNVDASKKFKRPEPRPDEDYTRDGLGGLGKNDRERWFRDERITPLEQLSDRFFNLDRKAFDKGHLVRREDVAWGSTYDELRAANGDTYHITNCSPQVKGFNRSSSPDTDTNWGDLENLVLRQADTERLSVFSGPVLDAADRIFVGVDDVGPVQVQIPSRYWKVIVCGKAGKLESFGFLLQQDLGDAGLEFAAPAKWRRFMIALRDLEPLAGVNFPKTMHDGDQIASGAGESVRRRADAAVIASAASAAGGDSGKTDLEPILSGWRTEQKTGQGEGARFVLNFADGARPTDGTISRAVGAALGLRGEVGPLFEPDPELDRHRLLTIAGVSRLDRSDMFEIARALRDATGADTVDPDLGSDYYDWDGLPGGLPPGAGRESADFAAWCWAGEADRPADPDWAIVATKVPQAWKFSVDAGRPSRGEGIRVFQPDTGVVPGHTELPSGIAGNPGAANLLEAGKPPIDPMSNGSNPGHGTGTGSVVASPEDGAMRGSAPRAMLVPVRCVESVAVFNQSRVAKAIDHARLNGAHVITMSLGGVFSDALHSALRKAIDANIIVIAAAGNCVEAVVWPARYEEAIAVGGVNAAFKPWRGSSHGPSVDISGPAEFVLRANARAPSDQGAVSAGQGTSFATAHLAGLAALWLAHHGREALLAMLPHGVRLQHVFRSLVRTGAIVPPGFDRNSYGAGVANAEKLLQLDPASALGHEAVFAEPTSNMRRQVAELLAEALGSGGLEAAAPALGDMQNAAELACLALDRLRAKRSRRAAVEAMPPQSVSPGLRRLLGARSHKLTRMGGGHA